MAARTDSNRDLWQFITGFSLRRPPSLVGEEIKRNKEVLTKCLGFYKFPRTPTSNALKTERKLEGPQLTLLSKLATFLHLDDLQCHDLFMSYLRFDYRGSQKELQGLLTQERRTQPLILKLRDYYFTERIYLLRCVKHFLNNWQDESNIYREQYADIVESLAATSDFISNIFESYERTCNKKLPTWETHGNLMNDVQVNTWFTQNLREQCELLEVILLYFKDFELEPVHYLRLATLFKQNGYGLRQTHKHLLTEAHEQIIHRIGCFQVLIMIVGMDLDHLQQKAKSCSVKEHHILSYAKFKELDSIMCSLGDSTPHGPLLLMWTVVKMYMSQGEDTSHAKMIRKTGNLSLQLKVFKYLLLLLNTEPFDGEQKVAHVTKVIIYSLLRCTLSQFNVDSLGDTVDLYNVTAKVLENDQVSGDFWSRGLDDGAGTLLDIACQRFPLFSTPLLEICTALAKGQDISAKLVVDKIHRFTTFTDLAINYGIGDYTSEDAPRCQLTLDKYPYGLGKFVLPMGTLGQFINIDNNHIIIWHHDVNGWIVLECEIQILLEQVARGSSLVRAESIEKVTHITKLLCIVMEMLPDVVPKLNEMHSLLFRVIQRFCLLSPPPLELIGNCISSLTCVAKVQPVAVWHEMQQTGLLPFLTENVSDMEEAISGACVNAGAYKILLTSYERQHGHYPVTLALLNMVKELIQPLHKRNKLHELKACVIYISREVFPSFFKWRYKSKKQREEIGMKCLMIFHTLLQIYEQRRAEDSCGKDKTDLASICTYMLLFTEAGRALLDIAAIGVEMVEAAQARQACALEGLGNNLSDLIRWSLSVLARLLPLRPPEAPTSPVEHALSAKPANRTQRHLVAIIAQYIFYRHDSRLCCLATLVLRRIAQIFPMSILACLGNDAEAIRDTYLRRLGATTEDTNLKGHILEFLTSSVKTQPGLTEMFFNIQSLKVDKKELSIGKVSCLQTVLSLIEDRKQGTHQCPSEILAHSLQFFQAIWDGRRETAMSVLREKEIFWPSIVVSLMKDLAPVPSMKNDGGSRDTIENEVRTCASIFKILAQELYVVPKDKLDKNLEKVLKEVMSQDRLVYWSKYVKDNLKNLEPCLDKRLLNKHCSVKLLIAWKNFVLILASQNHTVCNINSKVKVKIMKDILDAIESLFSSPLTFLHVKLASILSALYFNLIKQWKSHVTEWTETLRKLEQVLSFTCSNVETLIPSVQIGILGALTLSLQYLRDEDIEDVDRSTYSSILPVVCNIVQLSTTQLSTPSDAGDASHFKDSTEVRLKLQVITICLLGEIIQCLGSVESWLPLFKQNSIIQCLLSSVGVWMEAKEGIQYVRAVLQLFEAMSTHPLAAEALVMNGINQHLCLVMKTLYNVQEFAGVLPCTPTKVGNPCGEGVPLEQLTWPMIYRLTLALYTSMLRTLRYNFLQYALDFVGIHQDRMEQCFNLVRSTVYLPCILEAAETCNFLSELANYKREWRMHLPEVLQKLMTGVCLLSHSCIALLIRPKLLQHIIERQSGKEISKPVPQEKLTMTPLQRRLSQQSDDLDVPCQDVLNVQDHLLKVFAQCISTLQKFSPDLCQIIMDQSMDITEYEPILQLIFQTPSMDQESLPTFGTMMSCINMCVKLLAKIDPPRSSSPVKSPVSQDNFPIKRSLVMFVLENVLVLIMAQAIRYMREPEIAPRDKQLLKRDLGSELNSFLLGVHRYFRRGGAPTSPAAGNTSLLASPQSGSRNVTQSFTNSQEQTFFRFVENFVKKVLR